MTKYIYCKYCGAKLRRDSIGQYCPQKNCQWHHGLPKDDDTKRSVVRTRDRRSNEQRRARIS